MFGSPLRQILVAQPGGPAFGRILFRLGTVILRSEDQCLAIDFHCAFRAVEFNRLAARIVQIAAQGHTEFREIVDSFD